MPTTTTAVAFHSQTTTSGNVIGAVTARAAAGFDTAAGANQIYALSIKADELSGTNKFVRLKMTEVVNSPVDGAVIAIGVRPRYAQDVPQDMTA